VAGLFKFGQQFLGAHLRPAHLALIGLRLAVMPNWRIAATSPITTPRP
jgi:hypothetical protein